MAYRVYGIVIFLSLLFSVSTGSVKDISTYPDTQTGLYPLSEQPDTETASFESAAPEKNTDLAHLARGKTLSLIKDRINHVVFLPSISAHTTQHTDHRVSVYYTYTSYLHSLLQCLLYPKHSFW